MKQKPITIGLCVVAALTMAAQNNGNTIRIAYDCKARTLATNRDFDESKMILATTPEKSIYYNEMSLYCDSMTSTPDGKKQLGEIQMAAWVTQSPDGGMMIDMTRGNAPMKRIHTYVTKDTGSGEMTVYGEWGDEDGRYNEPLNGIEWEIAEDSISNILGYECVMATADYHGRRWNAWFTPEIPLSDGPWKLHGLPGLILLAESDGDFRFEATGIENFGKHIPKVYNQCNYTTVDRRKALANEEYSILNREAMLNAKYGVKITISNVDENGNPSKKKGYDRQRFCIETDF